VLLISHLETYNIAQFLKTFSWSKYFLAYDPTFKHQNTLAHKTSFKRRKQQLKRSVIIYENQK